MSNADHHFDHETLADLAEGLLDGERTESVRTHLAGCAMCRTREAEVSDVAVLLAETAPAPMPEWVTERIDVALNEEIARGPAATSKGARIFQFPVQRRWMRMAAAAAAAVVVVGISFSVAGDLLDGAPSQHEVISRPQQDGTQPGGAQPNPKVAGSGPAVTATGGTYTSATLGKQAVTLLHTQPSGSSSSQLSGVPAALAPLTDPRTLRACVAELTAGRESGSVAVDLARYEGRSAAVVVASQSGSTTTDVWVVAPSCSASGANVITHRQVQR